MGIHHCTWQLKRVDTFTVEVEVEQLFNRLLTLTYHYHCMVPKPIAPMHVLECKNKTLSQFQFTHQAINQQLKTKLCKHTDAFVHYEGK